MQTPWPLLGIGIQRKSVDVIGWVKKPRQIFQKKEKIAEKCYKISIIVAGICCFDFI